MNFKLENKSSFTKIYFYDVSNRIILLSEDREG